MSSSSGSGQGPQQPTPLSSPQGSLEYNQCQEAVKKLTEFLSHELQPDEEAEVQRHLGQCRGCFAKFHFEETLLRTIRQKAQSIRAPEALRAKILGLLGNGQNGEG